MNTQTRSHQIKIKTAIFRAMYRGSKEADTIIGKFTKDCVTSLTDVELDSLAELLCYDDHEILYWIEFIDYAPKQFSRSLLQKMNRYAFRMFMPHARDVQEYTASF